MYIFMNIIIYEERYVYLKNFYAKCIARGSIDVEW